MQKQHPRQWKCQLCDSSRGFIFSRINELVDHVRQEHMDSLFTDDLEAVRLWPSTFAVGLDTCPLCRSTGPKDDPTLIDHVLEHTHEFALLSLPWADLPPPRVQQPTDSGFFDLSYLHLVESSGTAGLPFRSLMCAWLDELEMPKPEEWESSVTELVKLQELRAAENDTEQVGYFGTNAYFGSETENLSLDVQNVGSDIVGTHRFRTVIWRTDAISMRPLEQQLREHMIKSAEPGRCYDFLPRNALEKLLTEEGIAQSLARAGCVPLRRQLEGVFSQFEAVDEEHSGLTDKSVAVNSEEVAKRKEILAILILSDNLGAIVDFIAEGIDDNDLPFEQSRDPDALTGRTLDRRDSDGRLKAIDLFSSWISIDVDIFAAQQWRIHVPVFSEIGNRAKMPPHWDLARKTVLPYLRSTLIGTGGFSAVSKVELHPGHYDSTEVGSSPTTAL